MFGMDRDGLRRIARRQFGVFTHDQAVACGYTAYQVRRRLADGEWQRIIGQSLASAGLRTTPLIRDRAAQLSIPGSVLAGPSAARTWQLPVTDRGQFLYVGAHGGSRLSGVRMLFETPDPRDVSLFQGLPTVSRAGAIVDCLRLLSEPAAATLLDRALQQRWIGLDELAARVARRRRRHGTPRLLRLLAAVAPGQRSVAERRLGAILRDGHVTGWRANVEIRDGAGLIGIVDVAFDLVRLVLEVDGFAFHTTPEQFEGDRQRQNRLVAAGWTVLRFTWRDLTNRPAHVLATIQEVVTTLSSEQS
jgi:very-short-patch-repair endonuclease